MSTLKSKFFNWSKEGVQITVTFKFLGSFKISTLLPGNQMVVKRSKTRPEFYCWSFAVGFSGKIAQDSNVRCRVFWPAKGCFACRSLVETILLGIFHLFLSKRVKKAHTLMLVDPFLCMFFLFFALSLLFLFETEKDRKTCLNVEKDDFDQQTMCEAPIHW